MRSETPKKPLWMLPAAAGLGMVVLAAVLGPALVKTGTRGAARDRAEGDGAGADVYASMVIPPFEARDQEGRPRDRSIFEAGQPGGGRYTVLNFIFTRCVTVCPITTGQMIRVQQAIKDLPGYAPASEGQRGGANKFQLVSFSVDPQRDTPASLKAHAEGFADFEVWTFLTSDQATVSAVVEKGLGFALGPEKGSRIDLGNGESMENIIHPSKLLLISPQGKVVGMYRGLDEEDVGRLIERIRRLNAEPRR